MDRRHRTVLDPGGDGMAQVALAPLLASQHAPSYGRVRTVGADDDVPPLGGAVSVSNEDGLGLPGRRSDRNHPPPPTDLGSRAPRRGEQNPLQVAAEDVEVPAVEELAAHPTIVDGEPLPAVVVDETEPL